MKRRAINNLHSRHLARLMKARRDKNLQSMEALVADRSYEGQPILIVGWKDIGKELGLKCGKTARKWCDKYHAPIIRMSGRPVIARIMLREWIFNLFKIVLKEGE